MSDDTDRCHPCGMLMRQHFADDGTLLECVHPPPALATDYGELQRRLRGVYAIPVNDGAGLLDGKDTFTRTFDVPPINLEAAAAIDNLQMALDRQNGTTHALNLAAKLRKAEARADQLAAENERLKREWGKTSFDQMREQLAQAQAALRMVEWVQMKTDVSRRCPWCERIEPNHFPDCPRQAALQREPGGAT